VKDGKANISRRLKKKIKKKGGGEKRERRKICIASLSVKKGRRYFEEDGLSLLSGAFFWVLGRGKTDSLRPKIHVPKFKGWVSEGVHL